jgi:hypothetical protein
VLASIERLAIEADDPTAAPVGSQPGNVDAPEYEVPLADHRQGARTFRSRDTRLLGR